MPCCCEEIICRPSEPAPALAPQIVYIYRMAQLFIVAFAAATLFLRTERHQDTLEDGRPYLGAILRQPFRLISTSRPSTSPPVMPPYRV
jgi:hypothetical protein